MRLRAAFLTILIGLTLIGPSLWARSRLSQPAPACPPTAAQPPVTPQPSLPPEVAAGPPPFDGVRTVAEPDPRVHAFYYPWYRTPQVDGAWVQWQRQDHLPAGDLTSNFYPRLGAYSSNDPAVVRQHMGWMRDAGIGVVIVSWAGVDHPTNEPVPLILDAAADAGLHVAWQIEPYSGRSAESVARDIAAIYGTYGDHPALWRVARPTRYGPTDAPRGVFYIFESCRIAAADWRRALDLIHQSTTMNAIVLGQTTDACFIDGCDDLDRESHFDGLYSYDALQLDPAIFASVAGEAARRGSIFSASVGPGYLALRGTGDARSRPRFRQDSGCQDYTYACMWTEAIAARAEWVSITSFNEWHEGTQIEPAASVEGYADYGPDASEIYLELTARYVRTFQGMTGSASR